MHIFFSGIGGTGIGPLALIAKQAGFEVSGSDKQDSSYIRYLQDQGIANIYIGQSTQQIAAVHATTPIDWCVYSSAVAIEQPDAPELAFCRTHDIRLSLRDELINLILHERQLKLVAVAGTHGKTTTTAMLAWLFKRFSIPVSYSVGGKIPFGDTGHYQPGSQYFVYEADEFARNFLAFDPAMSIITGVDWDHPDIYPTRESYNSAFQEFIGKSDRIVMWRQDAETLKTAGTDQHLILRDDEPAIDQYIRLPGRVNRLNGWEAVQAAVFLLGVSVDEAIRHINAFPGVSRRFEAIIPQGKLFSDYAHTPPKIRGALQTASEVGGNRVVVIYEGLHNSRQHFIKDELKDLFDNVKRLYIVPSYLAREDPGQELLTPVKLRNLMSDKTIAKSAVAELNETLREVIRRHLEQGDLVLCLSAGGGGSLDEWLRVNFKPAAPAVPASESSAT